MATKTEDVKYRITDGCSEESDGGTNSPFTHNYTRCVFARVQNRRDPRGLPAHHSAYCKQQLAASDKAPFKIRVSLCWIGVFQGEKRFSITERVRQNAPGRMHPPPHSTTQRFHDGAVLKPECSPDTGACLVCRWRCCERQKPTMEGGGVWWGLVVVGGWLCGSLPASVCVSSGLS